MLSYCATSPRSSAPWAHRRATVSSMSSTANMTRCRPSVLGGGVLRLGADRRGGVVLRQLQLAVAIRGPHHRDVAPDAVESDGAVRPKAILASRPGTVSSNTGTKNSGAKGTRTPGLLHAMGRAAVHRSHHV